eukprot:scaffold421184_cov56-Attheya_sp.AAC.4
MENRDEMSLESRIMQRGCYWRLSKQSAEFVYMQLHTELNMLTSSRTRGLPAFCSAIKRCNKRSETSPLSGSCRLDQLGRSRAASCNSCGVI